MNWLYKKWWKWLCVALLFYVIVGSFFVPLSPGISKVSPITFSSDSLYTFQVTAYNAHLKSPEAGKVQFWMKSGNDYYCPDSVRIINDNKAEVKFIISSLYQDSIKQPNFDMVANNDLDGTFALREGTTFIKTNTGTKDSLEAKTIAQLDDSISSALKNDSKERITDASVLYAGSTGKLFKCAVEVKHNKHQFTAFPYREILYETIRNTFFHVPMWFVMTALVLFSIFYSIMFLAKENMRYDIYAHQAIVVAILFGICGLCTGAVWAKNTWGQYWVNDPKLNGAAVGVIIYFAYIILRGSITDDIKRARIAAVYNIFALVVFLLFIFIIPRLTDSLHPGNGGNPAFSKYDLDNSLRIFFYPAVIGWILLGFWILSILIRIQFVEQKQEQ